ncbi:PIG-L family deacetylase [Streptomyces indicus]|uniref:GlcNAc-PI de-N-acetylase n=1 Tax=Streptomyces indicus TaxID=417292 RepID=A0A1G9ANV3_9ACTN|nr:PIG-L family deacetylase [Streptomyces indicus]SDK28923.1 GlcNAc-PI de-N-acetylase [Streptomyces indicus]
MQRPLSVVQVVAHPDDDLYFMNPATFHGLKAGTPTATVYLTAGDALGQNPRPWQTEPVAEDREAYGKARQNGIKAAYAAMALGERTAEWKASLLQTPDGPVAEVYSLVRAPWISLVFLNIKQHGTPEGPARSLHVLWRNEAEKVPTLVPQGGLVHEQYWYSRQGLISTLVYLFGVFRATLIRTMDPDPDRLVHDEKFPQRHDYGDLSDHCDHTAAALFAWTALSQYQGPDGSGLFTAEAFRGYYNERWPHNLGAQAVSLKEFFLNIYGAADGYDCGDPAGSGDYSVGLNSRGTGWVQSTQPRYPAGTNWLAADAQGRLTAFAVINQQAVVWRESAPGSDQWRGPFVLGGGPLAPGIAVDLTPDGRWQIFAERLSHLAHDDGHVREIGALVQSAPGGVFHEWLNLGNPSAGDARRDRHLGTPVVTRDGRGRLHLFVRNAGQGLHTRIQEADGTWGEWTDLRGFDLQEGLAALTAHDGRVEVFGSSREGVFHWSQNSLDEPLSRAPRFKLATPAGPCTAFVQSTGQVTAVFRQPDSARVLMAQEDAPGGRWAKPAASISGRGGYGAVAAATYAVAGGPTLLATRSDLGGVAYRMLPGDDPWRELSAQPLGGTFAHAPAAAFDALGRATVAVIGLDGCLHISRQRRPDSPELGHWQTVGG